MLDEMIPNRKQKVKEKMEMNNEQFLNMIAERKKMLEEKIVNSEEANKK